ncbi:MAG TPA: hypothetical protein VFO16_06680, partial [Pseudonocardiaceae bacterium]|nr:hypothetical protein [Pseudonocardiaceae bacterium]
MPDEQSGLFSDSQDERGRLDSQKDAEPAAAHPLEVSQVFCGSSSYAVRDELQELVRRDLLGPWDGETEQFRPRAQGPRERYLVGMLGPKRAPEPAAKQADQLPETGLGAEGDGEAELPDVFTAQNLGRIWASSMGLSFAVPADVDVLTVTATWGRYAKVETEDEDGKKRHIWAREPESYQHEVRLEGSPADRIPLTGTHPDQPGVLLAVDTRPRDGRRVVELALINAQEEPASNGDTAWLFQAALKVTALDGQAAVFLPIDDPLDDLAAVAGDPEEAHLRLLYRHHRRYASGRNI